MFIFLDTETTGTGPDDRICQIAFKPEGGPAVCETFNPGMPISIDAMSIHHITNRMVQGKPSFRGSDTYTRFNKDDICEFMDVKNTVRSNIWGKQSEAFRREATINVDGTISATFNDPILPQPKRP
jgi:hypothetical protein